MNSKPIGAAQAATTIAGCLLVAFCEGFDVQAPGVSAGGLALEFRPTADQLGPFSAALSAFLPARCLGWPHEIAHSPGWKWCMAVNSAIAAEEA